MCHSYVTYAYVREAGDRAFLLRELGVAVQRLVRLGERPRLGGVDEAAERRGADRAADVAGDGGGAAEEEEAAAH